MRTIGTVLALICVAAGLARAEGIGIVPCESVGEMSPVCGFRNPEDLVALPGGEVLVVSEMGHMMEPESEGGLALFSIESATRLDLPIEWEGNGPLWGESGCARPTHLNPHGIDLARRADGALAFYVVNHATPESIQIFEMSEGEAGWEARWRGCVVAPDDALFNDVAAIPGGGFVATHMWDRDRTTLGLAFSVLFETDTGFVWEWQPKSGFRRVPGTDGTMPNGIALSPDAKELFVNLYLEDRLIRVDRETGELLGEIEISQPDNVTVDEDGMLWVAGHHNFVGDTECVGIEGACPWEYTITRVDPKTMRGEAVLNHEGPPMGFATVALLVGEKIYLGSAIGDRIVSMPKPGELAAE